MKKLAAIGIILLLGISCQKNCGCQDWTNRMEELYQHNLEKITIQQGVAGTVSLIEGDCMPVVDQNSCLQYPVERSLHIFSYTTLDDVVQDGPTTFSSIQTDLIGSVGSDKEGFFELALEPGKYSIFIEEQGAYYANSLDGEGGIQPFEVAADSISLVNPELDYAVY